MGVHEATFEDISKSQAEEYAPLVRKAAVHGTGSEHETLIPVSESSFGYNYGSRPFRDVTFSVLFFLLVVVSVGGGIIGWKGANYNVFSESHYDRHTGCTVVSPKHEVVKTVSWGGCWKPTNFEGYRLFTQGRNNGNQPYWAAVVAFCHVLMVTLILSFPLLFGLLQVLRKHTRKLVYATLPFIIILPVVAYSYSFYVCYNDYSCRKALDPSVLIVVFVVVCCTAWSLLGNWDRVEVTIQIIKTGAEALHKNVGLLLVSPVLQFGYLFVYAPLVLFIAAAYLNGDIVPNPQLQDPDFECGTGDSPCCVWKVHSWVPWYMGLAGFTLLWSSAILQEIVIFTTSGTVAQWYFAPAESSTVGTTKRSLRHAFGPSFGTVCLSGLVVSFAQLIQSIANKSRGQGGQEGLIAMLIRCCLSWLLQAIEFITQFTTHFAAITGESFYTSAGQTFDLLRRNFLCTLVVEVVAVRLLSAIALVMSGTYALLVYGVVRAFTKLEQPIVYGLFAFAIMLLVQAFFHKILRNVINTVYICFGMDKDTGSVSKPEVHNVYVLLPASQSEQAVLAVPQSS